MPDQLQLRGGTTAQHASFTGASKEITVDTTKKTVVVHDGSTAGGNPVMREDASNCALALGSAGTPSLKFTGDTNTGIYSPGADQVSIATGGTERLRVDGAGQIEAVSLGTAAAPTFSWTGDPNTGIYSPGADQVAVATSGAGRLFIDASGNVGLGTSTFPYATANRTCLDVNGTSTSLINLKYGNTVGLTVETSSSASAITAGGSTLPLVFYTNSAERLRITSAGLVGVGTSSVTSLLTIKQNITSATAITQANSQFSIESGSGSGTEFRSTLYFNPLNSSGNGSPAAISAIASGNTNSSLAFYTNGSSNYTGTPVERLRIDDQGRVGIGTTSPGGKLDVKGDASSNNIIYLTNGNTGNYANVIQGRDANGTLNASISLSSFDNSIVFIQGASSERARIDPSGRLLVGTSSSPSAGDGQFARLAVQGSISGDTAYVSFARNAAATSITTGQGLGVLAFTDNTGNTFGSIVCQADANAGSGDYPGRLVFSTCSDGASSPTERMRINNVGSTYFYSASGNAAEVSSAIAAGVSNALWSGRHSATGVATGTTSVVIWSNGNIQNTNGSYTTLSDAKLKENIVDAGSQWDDLKAIQIRNWNFKAETGHETHRQIGPIAQELEAVCPGLVFETPDRDEDGNETGEVTKGVNQSVLYMKAVKALQEAMERIETLEAKVAALEA